MRECADADGIATAIHANTRELFDFWSLGFELRLQLSRFESFRTSLLFLLGAMLLMLLFSVILRRIFVSACTQIRDCMDRFSSHGLI